MTPMAGVNRGLVTLYFYGQHGCEVCKEAKVHVEAFKKANLLKVMVVQIDATRNVVSMVDIDPKSTPAYALLDPIFQPVKKWEGLLTLEQLNDFVFGTFANGSLKRKRRDDD